MNFSFSSASNLASQRPPASSIYRQTFSFSSKLNVPGKSVGTLSAKFLASFSPTPNESLRANTNCSLLLPTSVSLTINFVFLFLESGAFRALSNCTLKFRTFSWRLSIWDWSLLFESLTASYFICCLSRLSIRSFFMALYCLSFSDSSWSRSSLIVSDSFNKSFSFATSRS